MQQACRAEAIILNHSIGSPIYFPHLTNRQTARQSEAVFEAGWLFVLFVLGGSVSALGEGWRRRTMHAMMPVRYVHSTVEGKWKSPWD